MTLFLQKYILAQQEKNMIEQIPKEIKKLILSKKGVGYYNIDNIHNRDNLDKENNYADEISLGENHLLDNELPSCSFDLASREAPGDIEPQVESMSSSEVSGLGSENELTSDLIKTAILQLFDNGEDQMQRYKFKIRMNLTDGTNPEFIANLTKDVRNFRKSIPEEGRAEVLEFARIMRKRIKSKFDVYPYLGKLRMIQANTNSRVIEPECAVCIWYDTELRGWSGTLMFYNWVHEFDLFDNRLTQKQKSSGVKCQDTYTNPKHQKNRPLTWAERRKAGIK